MPDRVLYYIRHGETDWNAVRRLQGQRDVPLNETGRAQAARCGQILRELFSREQSPPDDHVASPLARARETMEIVRQTLGLPAAGYRTDERLQELSFGRWEGCTLEELRASDGAALAARDRDKWGFLPPQGESYAQLSVRVGAWLAATERDAVVVAHGGTMRALVAVLGIAPPVEAPLIDVAQGVVYRLTEGAMTRYC
jgi:broad specificity phosphatase PhoE